MRALDRDDLERLKQAWREASEAICQARRDLEAARDQPSRLDAERRLRLAEIAAANVREALLLLELER